MPRCDKAHDRPPMDKIKQQFSSSVMNYITLSLITLIGIALLSMFISFWLTDLADKDAHAINLSGSMRMQTYQIAVALQQGESELSQQHIKQLDSTWNHSLFASQRLSRQDNELNQQFKQAYQHWNQVLKPRLTTYSRDHSSQSLPPHLLQPLKQQVHLTDQLVHQFQVAAEHKIRRLRLFQLLALFITIVVGSLIFYLLKNRIEKPLSQLSQTVELFGRGDYRQRVDITGRDELSLLGATFNQMSDSIENTRNQLECRVKDRTEELHHKNISLNFLFNTARKIIDGRERSLDHQQVINELADILNFEDIELCLFTDQGQRPYLQVAPENTDIKDCSHQSCYECKSSGPFNSIDTAKTLAFTERYPIDLDDRQYGLITVRHLAEHPMEDWQEQLLRSTTDQLAIALSLAEQKEKERRLAMLSERTVIARELHDSLAQALSYLQIQVTRLQKSHDKQKFELQQPIIDELREGLSSAYRQLRELLTTFRLKMDADGLRGALESTVQQLQERTDMAISLDYQLVNLPLNPTEEIHLLQIVREASQNAVNHSKGKHVTINLQQNERKIELKITDDGIGIKESPEKLNHYGLAIMNERSRHLGGQVSINNRPEGGTEVDFDFIPSILQA